MTFERIRSYCLSKKGAVEDFPFGTETFVFKIGGKIFCLMWKDGKTVTMNLKCDPFTADELRMKYMSIQPGYHMNKRHWNSVIVDGTIPDGDIIWMIDHSYSLVVDGLKKAERDKILKL